MPATTTNNNNNNNVESMEMSQQPNMAAQTQTTSEQPRAEEPMTMSMRGGGLCEDCCACCALEALCCFCCAEEIAN